MIKNYLIGYAQWQTIGNIQQSRYDTFAGVDSTVIRGTDQNNACETFHMICPDTDYSYKKIISICEVCDDFKG